MKRYLLIMLILSSVYAVLTQGYKILEVKNAVLLHSRGSPTQHRFLWKSPVALNHSPLRRYYIMRNAIYTYKKFIFRQPIWVIKNLHWLVKNVVVIILFESDRKKKLVATFQGFC